MRARLRLWLKSNWISSFVDWLSKNTPWWRPTCLTVIFLDSSPICAFCRLMLILLLCRLLFEIGEIIEIQLYTILVFNFVFFLQIQQLTTWGLCLSLWPPHSPGHRGRSKPTTLKITDCNHAHGWQVRRCRVPQVKLWNLNCALGWSYGEGTARLLSIDSNWQNTDTIWRGNAYCPSSLRKVACWYITAKGPSPLSHHEHGKYRREGNQSAQEEWRQGVKHYSY